MARRKKEAKQERKRGKTQEIEAEGEKKRERKTEINFVMLLIFVLGIFAVIILGIKVFAKPKVISIDELHEKNIKGKLAPGKGYMYNGFSFVFADGLWFTKIINTKENRMYNVQLHYGPREVQNVSIEGEIMQFSRFNGTYITFDPLGADLSHVGLAASELSINLATFFNMMVVASCTKNETEICKKREIVNCENNDQNPIIYIEEARDVKIVQDKNCIRLQGNGYDLARAVDRLLYTWMGIM